jgi:hypothetical protein
MLAILAAVTEVIKEKGGSETNTEYYAVLVRLNSFVSKKNKSSLFLDGNIKSNR